MSRTVWSYGVPLELRPFLSASFPGFECRFPSIKNSILLQKSRIQPGGQDVIALWNGAEPQDLHALLGTVDVTVATVSPIVFKGLPSGETEVTGPGGVVGAQFRHRSGPMSDVCAVPQMDGKRLERYISELGFVYHAHVGSSGLDLKLPTTRRKRALVAPDVKWFKEACETNRQMLDQFIRTLQADYPKYDLFLVVQTQQDYIDALADGGLAGVVRRNLNPNWMSQADLIITNNAEVIEHASHKRVKVSEGLSFAGWDAPLQGDRKGAHLFGSQEAIRKQFLEGCHYFVNPDQDGPQASGLETVIALIQRLRDKTGPLERCETALTEDDVVDLTAVPFEKLTSDYQVTTFDDRSHSGTLTCILPFRFSEDRPDALERLRYAALDRAQPEGVEFLVVDDGSGPEASAKLRALCAELGYSFVYNDSRGGDFSVGRCRNIGAEYARTPFILMQDIDLMPYDGFYQSIFDEMTTQGMYEDVKHFLMVPYIFLTERGTRVYESLEPGVRRQRLIHAAITGDTSLVEKFSTGTSANVYNRQWYLSRGGNSADFEGWGYEDLEFNTRMIKHLNYFPLPNRWTEEKFNFNSVTEYRTYKAVYRLFGDMLMMKGIALFHAWHPVNTTGSYSTKANKNRTIFVNKLNQFDRDRTEPAPLPDRSKGRSLLFRKNPFTLSRAAAPALGEVYFLPQERALPNKGSLAAFLQEHQINRVVFFNPYQTPHMRRILTWVRDLGVPYVVAERGALPGSSFYDPAGFLYDSETYAPAQWDQPLNTVQLAKVDAVLTQLRHERPVLEEQAPAEGGVALRRRLGIRDDEKVIFVPLQRPGDTVTRFFTRDVSYLEFEEQVWDLASQEIPGVRVLIKTHPLEDTQRAWKHAINVDQENIYDLIEACDLVWCFNSGVGVLAMVWEKYCALSGAAFYGADGVNRAVSGGQEVRDLIEDLPQMDVARAKRFLHHLVENVYSFGHQETKAVRMPDGSRMTATMDIHYTTLRMEGVCYHFSDRSEPECGHDALLFDRYRNAENW